MKSQETRSKSADELNKLLKDLREELAKLRFQHRIRPLEDTSSLKKIRKDIARIETIRKQAA
ncbi:MAG: 50S ribosomal protein L29 [Deltaproteobacteria bacterium]|nr:MAG: 50S ribosomal protein L29 [Deltaproteobacteria bacterium]